MASILGSGRAVAQTLRSHEGARVGTRQAMAGVYRGYPRGESSELGTATPDNLSLLFKWSCFQDVLPLAPGVPGCI